MSKRLVDRAKFMKFIEILTLVPGRFEVGRGLGVLRIFSHSVVPVCIGILCA